MLLKKWEFFIKLEFLFLAEVLSFLSMIGMDEEVILEKKYTILEGMKGS